MGEEWNFIDRFDLLRTCCNCSLGVTRFAGFCTGFFAKVCEHLLEASG